MDNGVYGGAVDFESLILGAGPAGLQLGHHLSQAGRSYLILEGGDGPGTFFKRFPRHRTLISSDPETHLPWDESSLLTDDGKLQFKDYSRKCFPPADRLVEYLADYAECYALNLRCNTRVERIEALEVGKSGYRLLDQQGNAFTCLHLIVAAGVTKPYVPAIPGVGLTENYVDVSVDPNDFIDQKVLIIGKGTSAFETAGNLIETAAVLHVCSPNPAQLAWKTQFAGLLDTCRLKSRNAVLDASIESIRRDRSGKLVAALRHTHAGGEVEEIAYDRIILCTGFRYDNTIFAEDCRPELTLDDRMPDLTCEWESVNVPGVYFAGTLTQSRDAKKGTSAFIHGFRYNVRALHRMLETKYHGEPLPSRAVQATAEGLVKATLERVNRTSTLWQQLGFLHDAIFLENEGKSARYCEELPLAYIHETSLSASSHYYTVALELGKAAESVFLHPVIRRWNGPLLVTEHHLLEDPDGEWRKTDAHLVPLRDFFAAQLRQPVSVRA